MFGAYGFCFIPFDGSETLVTIPNVVTDLPSTILAMIQIDGGTPFQAFVTFTS